MGLRPGSLTPALSPAHSLPLGGANYNFAFANVIEIEFMDTKSTAAALCGLQLPGWPREK
jgi:hypothetical protein